MGGGGHWDPLTRTSSKCKVCISQYRGEIEEKLNKKESGPEISKWLKAQNPPEEVSRWSIKNHERNHGFKIRVLESREKGDVTVKEEHLESLNDFLDDVIKKVHGRVKTGELKPSVLEGVRAAEIKGKIKEGSKWEKELIKFFLEVSEAHGHSN